MSVFQAPASQRLKSVRRTILEGAWLNGQESETLGDLTFFVNGTVMFHGQAYGPRDAINVTLNQGAWRALRPAGSHRLTIIAGTRHTYFEYAKGMWLNTWYEVGCQLLPHRRGMLFGGPWDALVAGVRLLTLSVQLILILLVLVIAFVCFVAQF
jgi:hypothetical protein